jgi:hypothetical protein
MEKSPPSFINCSRESATKTIEKHSYRLVSAGDDSGQHRRHHGEYNNQHTCSQRSDRKQKQPTRKRTNGSGMHPNPKKQMKGDGWRQAVIGLITCTLKFNISNPLPPEKTQTANMIVSSFFVIPLNNSDEK